MLQIKPHNGSIFGKQKQKLQPISSSQRIYTQRSSILRKSFVHSGNLYQQDSRPWRRRSNLLLHKVRKFTHLARIRSLPSSPNRQLLSRFQISGQKAISIPLPRKIGRDKRVYGSFTGKTSNIRRKFFQREGNSNIVGVVLWAADRRNQRVFWNHHPISLTWKEQML